ncbi:MAG TPA: Fe-S protein assembly co-chaperone HscB [Bryobacteraceae bacterium]|nr:Fe-S protein assembly co-chaperone HscB [Bryobacteraceae bacterium]
MTDYYRLLGLEARLCLEPDDLERRFYQLSRSLHPDRFARASLQERRAAENTAALLNDAYRTLQDPLTRAEYLLRQEQFTGKSNSPALLAEVFELNQELEELKLEGDPDRLRAAAARFQSLVKQVDAELAVRFQEYDQTRSRATLQAIREMLDRRKYLANLIKELAAAGFA